MSGALTTSIARPAIRFGSWAAWAASGALGAGGFAALGTPVAAMLPGSLCPFRELTHLSCPTCGLTRALVLLAHGDLAASVAMHPWALALLGQAAAGWVLWGLWNAGRIRTRPDAWLPGVVAVNAVALVVLWALRLATGTLPPL